MEVAAFGKCIDKIRGEIRQAVLTATYRFNKTIAIATIMFIVTVAIVIYAIDVYIIGLTPVVC